MVSLASFNAYGITLNLPDGPITLVAGENVTILPQGDVAVISAQIPANAVINNRTAYQPPAMADSKAPNNSIYFSTDSSKLSYKDFAGISHDLY